MEIHPIIKNTYYNDHSIFNKKMIINITTPYRLANNYIQLVLDKVNVSFIPVVNVSGFVRNKRYNFKHQVSNYGFLLKKQKLSIEGKILIEHDKLIKELSKDGFLTMHENVDRNKGYLYLYSKEEESKLANSMIDVLKDNFEILQDMTYNGKYEDDFTVKNGIARTEDGSYEDYLFKTNSKFSITSETPMKDTELEKRINVNKMLIEIFIKK